MRVAPLALALAACATEITTTAYRCDVAIEGVKPTSAAPGDVVTLTGTPFTTSWDTAVYVGATRAVVEDVNRDTCDECDACVEDADCLICADCDACDVLCAACVEVATFVVPDVPAGETAIRLFNGNGESDPADFVVLAKPGDTGDSGPDTADSDPDTGPSK
jgi:hypothetical protein